MGARIGAGRRPPRTRLPSERQPLGVLRRLRALHRTTRETPCVATPPHSSSPWRPPRAGGAGAAGRRADRRPPAPAAGPRRRHRGPAHRGRRLRRRRPSRRAARAGWRGSSARPAMPGWLARTTSTATATGASYAWRRRTAVVDRAARHRRLDRDPLQHGSTCVAAVPVAAAQGDHHAATSPRRPSSWAARGGSGLRQPARRGRPTRCSSATPPGRLSGTARGSGHNRPLVQKSPGRRASSTTCSASTPRTPTSGAAEAGGLSAPTDDPWKSCEDRIAAFSPAARMLTFHILTDGLGPGELHLRTVTARSWRPRRPAG